MRCLSLEGGQALNPEYICLECGALFDEPKKWVERHGLDTPPYEEHRGCPNCGGAFVRTVLCDGCGEVITGDYVKIGPTGDCFCDSCFTLKSLEDDEGD